MPNPPPTPDSPLPDPGPSLREILTPLHDEVKASGLSDAELDALLDGEIADHRSERRERRAGP